MGAADLRNLGATSARWLEEVGVHGYDDLERLGSVEAYLMVRDRFPGVSLNLLYALEGALRDVRWDLLPQEEREALRAEAERRGRL